MKQNQKRKYSSDVDDRLKRIKQSAQEPNVAPDAAPYFANNNIIENDVPSALPIPFESEILNRRYTTQQSYNENLNLYHHLSQLLTRPAIQEDQYGALSEQAGQLKFELSAVLNKPKRLVRIHPIIKEKDLVIDNFNDEATFLTAKERHLIVRKLLDEKLKDKSIKIEGLFDKRYFPGLNKNVTAFILNDGIFVSYQEDILGQGAYGIVNLGMDLDREQLVAIKYQIPNPTERAILFQLKRLIGSYDRSIDDHYSIQTLAWGMDYKKYLKSTKDVSLDYFLDMVIKLLEAIDNFHQIGFIHGDAKFRNAMWDPDSQTCQCVDFGLSVKMDKIDSAALFKDEDLVYYDIKCYLRKKLKMLENKSDRKTIKTLLSQMETDRTQPESTLSILKERLEKIRANLAENKRPLSPKI